MIKVHIDVWVQGDPMNRREKYFDFNEKVDFTSEVAKLAEQIKQKNG